MLDRETVREIYDRNKEMLYRLCYFHTENGPDAADALQTTLVKLMEYKGTFNSLYHERCWLIKVATNECRLIRKHWWKRTISYEEMQEYDKQKAICQEDTILSELLTLPVKYRTVLYMHYYEGYSLVELSRLTGVNESTLRSRLMRGRKLLKIAIDDTRRG